jgi:hypothetical protein
MGKDNRDGAKTIGKDNRDGTFVLQAQDKGTVPIVFVAHRLAKNGSKVKPIQEVKHCQYRKLMI